MADHATCCRDYTRAQRAVAGEGLPAIEPGMPTPAGTGMTRRSMLLRTAGMTLAVYGAAGIAQEAFEDGIAEAAAGPPDSVLVSVFVSGGWDGLNVLAPVNEAMYNDGRVDIRLAAGSGPSYSRFPDLMWHPSCGPLDTLEREGKIAVMPAIGYDNPNQSHFTSRHYWEVGRVDPFGRSGWIGRVLDRVGSPTNPLQGLSLASNLSPALASEVNPVAAVSSASGYTFTSPGVNNTETRNRMLETWGDLGNLATGDPILSQARQAQRNAAGLRTLLSSVTATTGRGYPSGTFAARLRSLADMLAAGLPIRSVAITAPGGYDTHSGQNGPLQNNLTALSQALFAFQRDLEAQNLAGRVATLVWSEFGRRVAQNGSAGTAGTDHGAAGAGFLMGTRVVPQLLGGWRPLSTAPGPERSVVSGNLVNTSDFRDVYRGIVRDWFHDDPDAIITDRAGRAVPDLFT